MNLEKIKKVRKILGKILSPLLVVFLFSIVTISLVYKFTNNTFYFFNYRNDVVLSNSMSYKNEEHLEFLNGHDDQIQKGDLVISKKITNSMPLNVYDIVLFKNPSIGTDMHRIVEKDYDGEKFTFTSIKVGEKFGKTLFYGDQPSFSIKLNTIYSFSKMDAVIYSENPFDKSELYFNTSAIDSDVTVVSELQEGGYYKNIVSLDKVSPYLTTFSITRKSYIYLSYFESVRLYGGSTECLITSDIITGEEKQNYIFHPIEKFMIRGDAAKTEDGWFYREDIYSKVTNRIPKIGYFISFLSSPYGVIMIVGLAIIPVVYSFFTDKRKGKNNEG
ncbi:MAG: hypothetical protein K5906_01745 [Bacilli bacterium]|nr:hypothetical protein [Bacilli bacterium]